MIIASSEPIDTTRALGLIEATGAGSGLYHFAACREGIARLKKMCTILKTEVYEVPVEPV